MKNFIVYLVLIFGGLFVAQFVKTNQETARESKPVVRVFASSSFVAQWGPGPWIKSKFEETCGCRIEFFDGADSTILMQRLKSESRLGADLVLGFDQYDLEMARAGFGWKKSNVDRSRFVDEIQKVWPETDFVPYDWGVLSFVFRQSELTHLPRNFDELLAPEFVSGLSMQDPRTSSPGLQFFLWIVQVMGEDQAFQYLKKFNKQVKAYSTSWSMAYGLFSKSQAKGAFSYVTSPVYHKVEEKNLDVVAVSFDEGHPTQLEYMGIPATCTQCELAEKLKDLILSAEGQKIIMEKNYMFPVIKDVRAGTVFADVPPYRTLAVPVVAPAERERLLKKWSVLRRSE